MRMRPEQFTMWLRGVLETVGEGKPIPADVSESIYGQLSEVVAGQVADRIEESWATDLMRGKQLHPIGKLQSGQQIIRYGDSTGTFAENMPETSGTISVGTNA